VNLYEDADLYVGKYVVHDGPEFQARGEGKKKERLLTNSSHNVTTWVSSFLGGCGLQVVGVNLLASVPALDEEEAIVMSGKVCK
jgi:hypothetical protein